MNKTKNTISILFMDDDEDILFATSKVIEILGYSIQLCKNGEEVLEHYKKAYDEGNPYDIVILDLEIKHGLNGPKTLEQLKEINPNVKSILCSGYINKEAKEDFRSLGFTDVLMKPYNINELTSLLESAKKQ